MAAPREPDSDPDSVDPQTGAPDDASVDRLMEQAEALARELGEEVGLPEQTDQVEAPEPGEPKDPSQAVMSQVGRAEHAVSQVAEELGSEPERTGSSADMPSSPRQTEASVPALASPERKVRDAAAPASGAVADDQAEARVALAPGGSSRPERSRGPQDAGGSSEPVSPVPVHLRLKAFALECLEVRRKLLTPVARLIGRMSDVGRRWFERSQPVVRPTYAVLNLLDKPFGWVPKSARAPLGYVAIATLVMALLTFMVGWLR
jgi:hypothetical protein